MTSRADIVAALAAVPGLDAHPTITGPINAGMAWPVWRSARWANRCLALGSWYVMVALPNGGPDVTVAEADPLVEVIGLALMDAGLQVTLVEPYQIPVEPGQAGIPVLRYTVND